jgi:aspartyl-tRNA(Asn)/glutamyl-tRNA(Gln) amidotransferase subunit C
MSLTPEDITYIARLARLKTDPEEAEFYAAQLNRIMGLIDQINRIDTEGIEPMSHPQDVALRLREDVVTADNLRDEYQAIAPETEAGLYLVPRVIE